MKDHYPIEVLCKALCVSRSGYYQWVERRKKPSARVREDLQLAEQIREVHQQSGSTYGTPRLEAELRPRGHYHSRKRIDRIRRALGLCGRQKRRYRPRTTDSAHDEPIAPNRLAELLQPAEAISFGPAISLMSKPRKAGCTWRSSWIFTVGESSVGPLRIILAPSLSPRP